MHWIYEVDGVKRCSCHLGTDCDKPGKHPIPKGWTNLKPSPDEVVAMVDRWWGEHPNANIGMPTGSSGLVVIDLDTPEPDDDGDEGYDGEYVLSQWMQKHIGVGYVDWRDIGTLSAVTGSGGRHLVFRDADADGLRSGSRILPMVDVRARGGQIVVPPSTHASGRKYLWAGNGCAPASLHPRLREFLVNSRSEQAARRPSANAPGSVTDGTVLVKEWRYSVGTTTPPPNGYRDHGFNLAVFQLKKMGYSQAAAMQEVRRLWDITPGGGLAVSGVAPYAWYSAEEKVHRIYGDDHITTDKPQGPDEQTEFYQKLFDQPMTGVGGTATNTRQSQPQPQPQPPPENLAEGKAGGTGDVLDTSGVVLEPTDIQRQQVDRVTVVNEVPIGEAITQRYVAMGALPANPPIPPIGNGVPFGRENASDMGAAERLIRMHGGRIRYVPGTGWLTWNGVYWESAERLSSAYWWSLVEDIELEASRSFGDDREQWAKFAHACQSGARVSSIESLAVRDRRLLLDTEDLNSNPYLLVVRNGTLDLRTRQLVDVMDDYCTQQAGVPFEPDATCDEWERHVTRVTGRSFDDPDPQMASFLRRWSGYSLTGLVEAQKFAFCYGNGSNGKNVIIENLVRVLGKYGTTGSEQLLSGNSNDHPTLIADLDGSRMVFIDETPKGTVNDTRIKQLTGSTTLKARFMKQNFYEFSAKFKLWIASNHRPRVNDRSEGWWRRLDLMPFEVQIPAQNRIKGYGELLFRNEGSGILNWALKGVSDYLTEGMIPPSRVEQAANEYRGTEDRFGQFLADYFDIDSDKREWVPNCVLLDVYAKWYKTSHSNNEPREGMQFISSELQRKGYSSNNNHRATVTNIVTGERSQARGWMLPPLHDVYTTDYTWPVRSMSSV